MSHNILKQAQASNLFDLTGVVAVVTGGGSGIGLMMASTLMANGATVYLVGLVQADLDRVANVYNSGAEKAGTVGRMYGIEGDVSTKSEAKRIASEIAAKTPYVTVLFNNAGISGGSFVRPREATTEAFTKAYLDSVEQEHFDAVAHVNATGPYWMTFACLPLLQEWKKQGFRATPTGRKFAPQVIMTSSINGWTKDPATGGNSFPYLYSKSAIGHATSTLAHELLPLGIRVNGIAPGLFPTEMIAPGSANEFGESHIGVHPSELGMEVPCSQAPPEDGSDPMYVGSRADVGAVALCLVANWFINGETVLVDGGTALVHPTSW